MIAITGTNGKSTTTALIGHILTACGFDAQIGGNIGKSVLELAPPTRQDDLCAGNVQSFQIDLAPGLMPDVALLSNLTPDHIDRHGTHGKLRRHQGAAAARRPPRTARS